MKHRKIFLSFLLTLAMLVGLLPGMGMTAYAAGTKIDLYRKSMTISSDQTCTEFGVVGRSTLTINQGVTLTLNIPRWGFNFFDNSKIELHGTLAGSAGIGAMWMDRSYINVYLSDGAKYTVTGLSCEDGDNYLVYYGYDAATDGNGTLSVKNGSTDVTSASKGYKTTTYTFTATPNSGYKFKNWTKGAGGEVLGTDASINVTCEQNGQYQVYANFEADAVAVTGVTLNPSAAQTIEVDGKVSFTATVAPDNATDKKVKWSVGGTDAGAVKLYSDEACTTEVGANATETLTVYAKGMSAGSATVTATSNADGNKTASCAVTVNAAQTQTDTLLTTITATGKEKASYNPENVASVSFSYTAGGSSAYLANWGWWGYGWTATVNAAEGYTITKCVFYDDANRKATDSEEPFVVKTTEEDKTPRINGTPIDGGTYQSKGIKKIEVYGYATPAATHSVTITAGDHMTKTEDSGDAEQTGLTGAMTDVVYTADDGYYFPTNYSVAEVSGIKVTRDSYTQITVSGTPTADAAIALTAPTAKATPDAPTTATATDCTTADNNDGKLTGVTTAMEYKKSDADSWTDGTGSDITGLVPGTYYVRVKSTDTTNASTNQELTIKGFISYTVTFKVVNGKWNDETTADKTATLTGHEGDTLKLAADQIPAVGTKPDDNYKAGSWDTEPNTTAAITAATTYTYTYAEKAAQTIAADNVTATYGDTGKSVSASVTDPATGGGAISYAVKSGSEDYIAVDASSGALTINKAGTATVVVTAAATADYTAATKEVTVTINKADPTVTAPTASTLTYSGSAQALVTAGEAEGGTMYYAVTTENTAPTDENLYTTDIPAKTNAGTYYVWYKVAGDSNHNDTAPAKIEVKINPNSASPTAPTTDTLNYTGEPQALVTGGSVTGGELQYALGTDAQTAPALESFTTTVPKGTDAGDYFVWYRVKGDANHNDVAPACIPVSIAKAAIAPTVSITGWTYGEDANAPSVDGNPGNGEVTYAYSDSADGTYSATVPTNAGTWFVRAVVAETDNYQGATTEPLSFAIAKAAITITADNKSSVYGADIAALTWKVDGSYVAGDELGISATTTASKTSNVGSYPITVAWNNNANYTATLVNGAYTITKASFDKANLTDAQKPTATDPIYNGGPLALVNAPSGLPTGYTKVQYSIDGGNTWTDAIPTGTEIDSYSVNVKYVGDGNHNDFEGDAVVSIISAKPSGMLIATMVSEGDTSLKLSWAGAEGVGGYDIYFKVCDGKGNYPLIATVEGGDVTSYTVTGLAKNRSYKAYVCAWIKNGGSKQYVLSSSPTVHAYTANGTKKIANPGSLTLKTPSMTVKLGKTKSIKATVKTVKKGNLATHVAKLRYISSNTSVATVTSKGKVKAVGAGSCKIYVLTTNGIWRTVTVTVDTNPTKVSISKPSKTMKVGATQNLGAKVKLTPAKAITTLKWKSSNPAVATVDANGVVTAIKKGKTVITVTTANGKKAKVTIKVK